MKRLLWSWLFLTSLAAVALAFARLLAPGWFELELDVFILFAGGIAIFDLVLILRESYPLQDEPAIVAALRREPDKPQRPAQLERLERELTMATATAFDLHARLRPQLREIATMRLATRGVRLEDAESVLDPELWELVRPDRQPPADRHAEGIAPTELRRAVEELEAL
ncbi:MAG TPA: hypothetical protein VFK71_01550 [Gaiellaceae bacterium]|nr:hypothetical protein [Gaiellaceae bacterium]